MEEMMTTVETTVVKKIDGSENSGYDMFAEPTKLTDPKGESTGECENDDVWLFCNEELDNYLRNHNLEEDEPYLKQTDKFEDYKSLNRLLVEQMADMPFEELVTRLEANQTR